MQTIGVIPARLLSTRLAEKMLIELKGKPLIQHTFENAQKCTALDAIIVATDSNEIKSVVEQFGGQAVLTSRDHPSGTDRIAEAVLCIEGDVIVNIQGDEPFLPTQYLSELIAACQNPMYPMATLAHPMSEEDAQSPHNVKVTFDHQGRALYFSRSVIPYKYNTYQTLQYYKHIGVYAYRKDFLLDFVSWPPSLLEQVEQLEQLRALEQGISIHVTLCEEVCLGIDTQDDLLAAQKILSERNTGHA